MLKTFNGAHQPGEGHVRDQNSPVSARGNRDLGVASTRRCATFMVDSPIAKVYWSCMMARPAAEWTHSRTLAIVICRSGAGLWVLPKFLYVPSVQK